MIIKNEINDVDLRVLIPVAETATSPPGRDELYSVNG
jgi:hypothetical protein